MLATQIDRERDLCTSSGILAVLQNKGVCFYHTLWDAYGKMENTTSLDLSAPPFNHSRILCTKILNQLKMFQKREREKNLNFSVLVLTMAIVVPEILMRRFMQERGSEFQEWHLTGWEDWARTRWAPRSLCTEDHGQACWVWKSPKTEPWLFADINRAVKPTLNNLRKLSSSLRGECVAMGGLPLCRQRAGWTALIMLFPSTPTLFEAPRTFE